MDDYAKSDFKKRLDHRAAMVPESGYNLVSFDEYEDPGYELTVLRHFDNKDEAMAALKEERDSEKYGGVYYLYAPKGEGDPEAKAYVPPPAKEEDDKPEPEGKKPAGKKPKAKG